MTKARLDALYLLLLGSAVFLLLGAALEYSSPVSMADFKAVYYGARCMIQHVDPYRAGLNRLFVLHAKSLLFINDQ